MSNYHGIINGDFTDKFINLNINDIIIKESSVLNNKTYFLRKDLIGVLDSWEGDKAHVQISGTRVYFPFVVFWKEGLP